jgi:hypothetical protein
MSEQAQTEEVVEVPSKEELLGNVEEQQEGGEVEYSEVEQKAIELGWNPEGVEGKPFLSAEEFVGRQPLYDDIRSLKKQQRKLQEGIEAMKEMQKGIRERERTKVLNELKAQKKLALENENYDAVIEIDDQIAEHKAAKDEPQQNEQFEAWVENNEWYHQDSEMKQYADMIGAGYFQTNPNKKPEEVFEYVTKEVKTRFAEKFGNPNRSRPNPVEGASRGRPKGGAKHKVSDLPPDARSIMNTILRTGTMTEAEYLKDYFGE